PTSSNNFNERYSQIDPALAAQGVTDPEFQFQGYMVFQLKDGTVSNSELFDTDRARLVAQCDLKDTVTTIVNRTETHVPGINDPIVVDQVMVEGENKGIFHSVRVVEDLFAEGADRRLHNYTTYYYYAIAYAWNGIPSEGRKFVQGNGPFRRVPALPHRVNFEANGTILSSLYGDELPIDQLGGVGNGGRDVQFRPETEAAVVDGQVLSRLGYLPGKGPIAVRVTDPKSVQRGTYYVEVVRDRATGVPEHVQGLPSGTAIDQERIEWILYHGDDAIFQSTYIERRDSATNTVLSLRPAPLSGVERVIPEHGLAISVTDPRGSGVAEKDYNPVIAARQSYADASKEWLGGFPDIDRVRFADWIMSGIDTFDRGVQQVGVRNAQIYDPEENYEQMLGGTWSPMCLVRGFVMDDPSGAVAPGVNVGLGAASFNVKADSMTSLAELPDVDIVITPDPTKWSRCVVVETSPAYANGSGANALAAKYQMGLDRSLRPMPGNLDVNTQGWSMFPGYAIDVNTGQRLNIFFGENTWDKTNRGGDMLWNPTASFGSGGLAAGGRHYVYVSNTPYDECAFIHTILAQETKHGSGAQILLEPTLTTDPWVNPTYLARVYKDVAWVGVPMGLGDHDWEKYEDIPCETRVSLRVNQPFTPRPNSTDVPLFEFNTEDFAAQTGVTPVATQSLLQDVRVVPNPYYGFSEYERAPVQTIVKVTNLPQRCKIRIYNLSGSLIRTYDKNSSSPEQTWDLKNADGVPVSSGAYIIHVDGFELGETIVKLFTVMPQIDINTY
ncbi:MAG: T9SS type A sorting domain-containing protein, partial [Bacteroidia bacterium]